MPFADFNPSSGDFLRTMQLRLRAGRELPARANPSAPAIVVSESLARVYFRGEDPIGRRIQTDDPDAPWLTIVGIGGDIWHGNNGQPPRPMIYPPLELDPPRHVYLAVRTAGEPAALAASIRGLVAGIDPDQAVSDIKTMDRLATESNLGIMYLAGEMALFGGIALVLAMSGVYGVMAYSVGERRHEIGIRMAVGASRGAVIRLVIGNGLKLTGAGILIGLAAAHLLTRLLAGITFGARPDDPLVFVGATAALALAALAACYFPARRAASLEAGFALRGE
jgi:putative ABC transport system permease protein